MCLFLLVAICESVICMEFSLQKYRPRANVLKKCCCTDWLLTIATWAQALELAVSEETSEVLFW